MTTKVTLVSGDYEMSTRLMQIDISCCERDSSENNHIRLYAVLNIEVNEIINIGILHYIIIMFHVVRGDFMHHE